MPHQKHFKSTCLTPHTLYFKGYFKTAPALRSSSLSPRALLTRYLTKNIPHARKTMPLHKMPSSSSGSTTNCLQNPTQKESFRHKISWLTSNAVSWETLCCFNRDAAYRTMPALVQGSDPKQRVGAFACCLCNAQPRYQFCNKAQGTCADLLLIHAT